MAVICVLALLVSCPSSVGKAGFLGSGALALRGQSLLALRDQPLLALRGGALDIKEMVAAAKDPAALAELQAMMADPAAMAEIREMMDDPDFRAEIEAAIAAGGDDGMRELKEAVDTSGGETVVDALGPSLGANLDTLKLETSVEEFETACGALRNIVGRRRKAEALGEAAPKLRVGNERLEADLLRHEASRRCLRALGYTEEDDASLLVGEAVVLDGRQLKRAVAVIDEALSEALNAAEIAAAHELPYARPSDTRANSTCGHMVPPLPRPLPQRLSPPSSLRTPRLRYKLALQMPSIRRACREDPELGRNVTALLLQVMSRVVASSLPPNRLLIAS